MCIKAVFLIINSFIIIIRVYVAFIRLMSLDEVALMNTDNKNYIIG